MHGLSLKTQANVLSTKQDPILYRQKALSNKIRVSKHAQIGWNHQSKSFSEEDLMTRYI